MSADRATNRYASHLALPRLGTEGQCLIGESHAVLIGLGGLGCAAAQYLVASGIGRLTLCDFDTVAESNLSRQILYGPDDIDKAKTDAARAALARLNPEATIATVKARMDEAAITDILPDCALLIDASDNYGTRLASNRACLSGNKPWVMGSCIRMEGQLMLFNTGINPPCYRCVYGSAPETLEDCPGAGVFSPVAGVIGAAMAHLSLGHLAGTISVSGFQVLDATRWEWRSINIRKKEDCPDCGA
jgi:adenylyltransferase/sulfurtransferase